ncbi:HEAT repeat domain-containing protein [Paractinoplanes durhamensis]|uniref:HEAT repeat domain-containing protein n=1 Tax=Paractinoplanes durhamensis TaxID=113563 RepID=A0ABQ3Z761_9ACTN|nr:HEAT repeat domain-containing protein [Actinoplanes durhamensis]GIE05682.1 hypothetical protein Adu01nite_70320 [Actinoplanes durhamensis]
MPSPHPAGHCSAAREWLANRPLRDDPRMAGHGSSLTWDDWVRQGRDAEACLLEFLRGRPDPVMRSDIALALGFVGGERGVGPLIDLLTDEEPAVVMEAAAALGRIGDPDAVPHLIEALTSADPNVRANACQALGELRGDRATAAVTATLGDSDPFVRAAAQQALIRIRR